MNTKEQIENLEFDLSHANYDLDLVHTEIGDLDSKYAEIVNSLTEKYKQREEIKHRQQEIYRKLEQLRNEL